MESLYYLYIDRDGEEWECIQITATYEWFLEKLVKCYAGVQTWFFRME